MSKRFLIESLAMLVLAGASGCARGPEAVPETPTAEKYYEDGLKVMEGERRFFFFHSVDATAAISAFQEVIDNYPYSDFATLAELRIADIQFDRHRYEEAASYYQDFIELHPNNESVPYALYRNGLCSFEQIRTSDRDQSPTRQAIASFRALLERFPDTDYAANARERLQEAEDHLAEQDTQIGDFYFDRGDYHAAAQRYRAALEKYPNHTTRYRTMAQLGFSLAQLNQNEASEAVLRQVLAQAPGSAQSDAVRIQLNGLAAVPGYRGRTLRNACVVAPGPACDAR